MCSLCHIVFHFYLQKFYFYFTFTFTFNYFFLQEKFV